MFAGPLSRRPCRRRILEFFRQFCGDGSTLSCRTVGLAMSSIATSVCRIAYKRWKLKFPSCVGSLSVLCRPHIRALPDLYQCSAGGVSDLCLSCVGALSRQCHKTYKSPNPSAKGVRLTFRTLSELRPTSVRPLFDLCPTSVRGAGGALPAAGGAAGESCMAMVKGAWLVCRCMRQHFVAIHENAMKSRHCRLAKIKAHKTQDCVF
jgi:hypothetical protein